MYPHGRSLVERLEGKPFVILGVNSDSDKDDLRETLRKENITWRSGWDGGNTSGPIARKWNVHSWPTVYVLDPKGIIRYRDVHNDALDEAIDAILAEQAAESKAES